ncbi:glycosyltransferase [bacterium]|nr:glycosyltransferase [bacterium]
MISILIAAYNNRLMPLVRSLHEQASRLALDFEIRIHENGQDPECERENRELERLPKVFIDFRKSAPNRASSRNWLASQAQGRYLLFLDGDSFPTGDRFIEQYVQALDPKTVLVGGTAYRAQPPDLDRKLRWVYGTQREVRSASERNRNPYSSFSSFNFVLPAELKEAARFDESIQGYGHEDTMLGYSLKHRCIRVVHIDNPMYHDGLDPNNTFVQKSLEAVANLKRLIDQGRIDEEVTLYRWMTRVERSGTRSAFIALWRQTRPWMERTLGSGRGTLVLFDLLRLGALLEKRAQSGSTPMKKPL